MRLQERVLKPTRKTRYPLVGLHRDGVDEIRYVHHLVWEAFCGPLPGGHSVEVNHKDLDKQNNALSNLELVTSTGNKIHARDAKRAFDRQHTP